MYVLIDSRFLGWKLKQMNIKIPFAVSHLRHVILQKCHADLNKTSSLTCLVSVNVSTHPSVNLSDQWDTLNFLISAMKKQKHTSQRFFTDSDGLISSPQINIFDKNNSLCRTF